MMHKVSEQRYRKLLKQEDRERQWNALQASIPRNTGSGISHKEKMPPTYAEVRAKYQPEIDRIEMENDVELEMLWASQEFTLAEIVDNLTPEQSHWFLEGLNKSVEMRTSRSMQIESASKRLHNIYLTINRELGIDLPTLT